MDSHEEFLWTPSNSVWDAVAECDFLLATKVGTTQSQVGPGHTPEVSLYDRNNVMASGRSIYGNTDASVPRFCAPLEQLVAFGNHWSPEFLHDPNRIADYEKAQRVTPEYITNSRPSDSNKTTSNQWEAKRSEIYKLYIEEDLPLPVVMNLMAKGGFNAKEHMYKKRFKRWGWKKNQIVKDYAKPDSESSIPESCAGRPFPGRKPTSTCTAHEEASITSCSRCSAVVVFDPTRFDLVAPTTIRRIELDEHVTAILFHVRSLYIGSIEQEKWQVKNQFVVQEDIHDDLLVSVASALRNFESLELDIGWMGIRKAFMTLEKVVADCGLFSLPIIWESFLRMIRKGHNEMAKKFLEHALQLAIHKTGYGIHHPFVQVINGLLGVKNIDPHMLEQVILCAYRSCVDHVIQKLSSSHLTTLSLWGDFVVYVDNSSASETKQALDSFRHVMRRSEEDNGVDDDFTLEILGLTLYVLQSTKSTAAEAELVALDMLRRVNRRVRTGEKLEGTLLITWKDLKHTLGNFCHAKGELRPAVMHVEDCLMHGVVDDRDIFALNCLEEWYVELGELNEAKRVRQLRISSSQRLFREDKIELTEGEGVGKEDEGRDDKEKGEDGSEDESEDEGEDKDEEVVVDEDAAENENAEEELKILQREMYRLKQRMDRLQKKVEKNKEKEMNRIG